MTPASSRSNGASFYFLEERFAALWQRLRKAHSFFSLQFAVLDEYGPVSAWTMAAVFFPLTVIKTNNIPFLLQQNLHKPGKTHWKFAPKTWQSRYDNN